MPHGNGKIWSEVNNGVKVGINETDVSAVLGVGSYDWVTLGTHDRNNKWSRRKPIRGESPADYAEPWTARTGSVREATGLPIYWGMTLPFNTAAQLQLSENYPFLKPLAWRASHRTNYDNEANVQNYVYCRPVKNLDFVRWADYDGYNQYAVESWTAGVAGAQDSSNTQSYDGSTGMKLDIDTFDNATVEFYMGSPAEADIKFSDLFTAQGYRFFVEIYKNDSSISADTTAPAKVLVSIDELSSLGANTRFVVNVNWLMGQLGITPGQGVDNVVAVLGVNRFGSVLTLTPPSGCGGTGYAILTGSDIRSRMMVGAGSIPPWSKAHKPFICDIKFRSFSKITIAPQQYAGVTNTNYQNMPTSPITWSSDGLRLKCVVSNKGTSSINLRNYKFCIQARGTFNLNDPSVAAMCINAYEGKWSKDLNKTVYFSTSSSLSDKTSAINIASNSSVTVYFECMGFMPKGTVNALTMQISDANSDIWMITASFTANFNVG